MTFQVDLPDLNIWLVMAEPEQQGAWAIVLGLVRNLQLPPKHCTDAYLAALAMTNGWRLVSFDRDFKQFDGLDLLPLS